MYNQQLDTFLCVADAGSFNKAAERLYISPPAVIKQINLLEESLGLQLFVRTHRGLQLTPAECALFGCLLGRIGRPVTREEMLNRIWGTSVPVRSRTTDMHITHLRRKLDLKDEIVTVFQVGYMLRR